MLMFFEFNLNVKQIISVDFSSTPVVVVVGDISLLSNVMDPLSLKVLVHYS